MNFTIKIIRGDDAHQLRDDHEFIDAWAQLAQQTSHTSVFQEPAFVNCWHQEYKDYFDPIFVLGHNESAQLIGLIPLTIDKETGKLTHAGAWHAEYHGWLCTPDLEEEFLTQALTSIKNEFSLSTWNWTYLPPGSNTTWLESNNIRNHGIHIQYESMNSPLMDLQDEEKLKKILKSKSIKSKINRLKRNGDLRIERITSKEQVEKLIDQIEVLVNFRHEAVHHVAPFETDYLQRSFYLARSDYLQDNHFSVLWMGDKLLAFHFGCIDKDTIYIGLTAFDPTASKHSPGVIFLIYLAQLLQQEGIQYIDLTPGGDEYKERFSNKHQTLAKPTLYFNRLEKIKSDSKGLLTKSISKLALNRKIAASGTQDSPHGLSLTQYSINIDEYQKISLNNNKVNVQNFQDLLLYKNENGTIKRPEVLSRAMQYFSQDEILFTLVEKNTLVAHTWASKVGARYKRKDFSFDPGKDSCVLDCLDLESHVLEPPILEKLLPKMLQYCFANDAINVFMFLPTDTKDCPSAQFMYKIGFKSDS